MFKNKNPLWKLFYFVLDLYNLFPCYCMLLRGTCYVMFLANNSGEWNRKVLGALQTFLCLQGASAGLFSRSLPNFRTFRDDSPTSHAPPVLVLHLPLLVESFWWCLTQFLSPLQQSLICLKVVAVFALHLGFFRLNKPNSHSLQLC